MSANYKTRTSATLLLQCWALGTLGACGADDPAEAEAPSEVQQTAGAGPASMHTESPQGLQMPTQEAGQASAAAGMPGARSPAEPATPAMEAGPTPAMPSDMGPEAPPIDTGDMDPAEGDPNEPDATEPPDMEPPDMEPPDMEPPDMEPPGVACDPADRGPEPTPVSNVGTGGPPVGEYETVVETDPGLPGFTIFRPANLGDIKHPVFAWGNGGCIRRVGGFAEFLLQFAAEGIVVVGDGTISGGGGGGSSNQDGSALIEGIDWAEAENERPCSQYYRKLDLTKVAVGGQSCGGLMAINASTDERIAASMPMNSGLFTRNTRLYERLHAPMAIIDGGPSDIAYENGLADFNAIDTIPVMFANVDVGHGGTYRRDNGGSMGTLGVAWLRWWLLDDEGARGKGYFVGPSCGVCGDSSWDIMWKMQPQ